MTRDEVKVLIMSIKALYPNFKVEDMRITINVWADVLQDFSGKDIERALKDYSLTDTSGFAPSISQLVTRIPRADVMSKYEAWELVHKAIKNGIYGAEEEFDKLPERLQKLIGGAGQIRRWAMDGKIEYVQNQFMKNYTEPDAEVRHQELIGFNNFEQRDNDYKAIQQKVVHG